MSQQRSSQDSKAEAHPEHAAPSQRPPSAASSEAQQEQEAAKASDAAPVSVADAEPAAQAGPDARQQGAQPKPPAPADGGEQGEAAPSVEQLLERAYAERDRYREQLLRTAADFDNYRKRMRRELQEAERRGREEVLRELLPVFDNLERAAQAASSVSSVEAIAKGVEMVLRLFRDVSERLGLERIQSVGARFDPAVHDAVQRQETDEHPPGSIVGEVVPGYRFQGRLLRAAMVAVAAPKRKEGSEGGATSEQPARQEASSGSAEASPPARSAAAEDGQGARERE